MKETQNATDKLRYAIYGHGQGWVFTPADFPEEEPRRLGVMLGRLTKEGTIRRLGRGLYDYPKRHPQLGMLTPPPEKIAQALAGRAQTRLLPTGAYAANLLHLSEQVPARIVFLTDGPSRNLKVGNMQLQFRKTAPRYLAAAGRTSGLVIQALRYLGKGHIDPARLAKLRADLRLEDRAQLQKDAGLAPAWMRSHLSALAPDA